MTKVSSFNVLNTNPHLFASLKSHGLIHLILRSFNWVFLCFK